MTLRRLFAAALIVSVTLGCVRLGVWQLSRLAEKRALNAALQSTLAAPPLVARAGVPTLEEARGHSVEFHGSFDPRFQVLLRGRPWEGAPGVIVVTPFVLAGDTIAVLVERGWLPAEDAATVPAALIPEDSSGTVVGLARVFAGSPPIPPMREVGSPERQVWSAPRLDPDSMRARLPYRIAPYFVQALPAPGAPVSPARDVPRPYDEMVHLGYALQWFAIAVLIPASAWFVARRRART